MKAIAKTFAAALLFTGTTVLFSCNKDDDDDMTRSRSELIVGTWNLVAYGVDQNNNGTLETSEQSAIPAGTGLREIFNADKTGSIITTTNNVPTGVSITWSLENNDNTLKVTGPGTNTTATILTLTSSTLIGYDPAALAKVIYVLEK